MDGGSMSKFRKFILESKDARKLSKLKAVIIDHYTHDKHVDGVETLQIASKLGFSEAEANQIVRDLLASFLSTHRYSVPKDIDEKQLEKGIKHEMEHTTDEAIARKIAIDHISEIPNYYGLLEEID
jgi:nitrate reductase beta subunit